jgi:predicted RNase H-like nuclease (RuvC/YqgF family)
LTQIVDNGSLSIRSKFQHALKTVVSFYESRQRSLSETAHRTQKKNEAISRQIGFFVETIGAQLLYRPAKFGEVVSNDALQGEIVGALKKLKSELIDALAANEKLQQSFPAEELAKLREVVSHQKGRIRDQKAEIRELRESTIVPTNAIAAMKEEIAKREKENQRCEEQLKRIRKSVRYQHFLKKTVNKLNDRIEELQQELREREEAEKSVVNERLTALHNEKIACQREISLIKHGTSKGRSEYHLDADSDGEGTDWEGVVRRLEDDNRRLRSQLDSERAANVHKIKESKLESISEYQNVLDQLGKRSREQRNVITSLTSEHECAHRKR